jgi:N-sulfoglucosamine sulfohydrolase
MRSTTQTYLLLVALLALSASFGPCTAIQAADRPNILFAIADDWSFGHATAYGCSWVKTPGFDRVAQRGILFHRAYTPNAKCAPSRASILTGRNSWQLEEASNHMCIFPTKYRTVVEALEAGGYFTGYTGKGWGPGLALHEDGRPPAPCRFAPSAALRLR